MQRRKTVPASMIHKKKTPAFSRQGVTDYRIIGGKRQQYTADHSPDRVSLLHKGGFPICNSGCSDSIVENTFVLRANSPSRWHLTRCLLLCSWITIHDLSGNVNRYFIDISLSIPYLCYITDSVALFCGFCCRFRRFSQSAERTMIPLNT